MDGLPCTAAESNSHELARVLVEYNADVNTKDNNGWTALHWAVENNSNDIARVLVEHNAEI